MINTKAVLDSFPGDVLNQSPLIVNVFTGKDHITEFLHPDYLRLHPLFNWFGHPAREVLRDAERPAFFSALDQVFLTGKPITMSGLDYQDPQPGKAGKIFDLHLGAWKTAEGNVFGVICNMVEVTSAARTLEALQASKRLFQQVAEAVPQLVWIADSTGNVIYYNHQIAQFAGASKKHNGQWEWVGMLHEQDVQPTAHAWSTAIETGSRYEMAHRVMMADGSYRWHLSRAFPQFNEDGGIVNWFGTATDIHFQKESEAKLEESEERLRIAMEAAELGTWDYHFDSGLIVTSSKFREIFGLSDTDRFSIEDFFAMVHPDDVRFVSDMHQRFRIAVDSGISKYEIRYRILAGGSRQIKWVKSNRKVFFDPATGKSNRFIGTMLDVTREVDAEERLRSRQAMLEAQNDAIPDGIIMLDTKQEILSYNKRFQEIWNIDQSTLDARDGAAVLAYIMTQLSAAHQPPEFKVGTTDRTSAVQELHHVDGRIFERHGNAVVSDQRALYGWAWYFREVTNERNTERDLRRQKELYQHLLEGISDSFISFDTNWNIVYANDKALQLMRQDASEVMGRNVWAKFPSLIGSKLEEVYRRVMLNRVPEHVETQSTISRSWFEIRVYPIPDGIAVFSSDISIRRHAEEELHYQKQLLQTVTENTSLALFLMDANQHCIYVNEAGERMTGFSKSDLQGKQLHYFLHHSYPDGSYYPLEECPIDQALPTRMRMSGEEVFVHKNGTFFPVFFTASPIIVNDKSVGTVIEVRDTTQEKKAELALKQSEERFRSAFANASIGMAITDKVGNFEQVNHAYIKITGYSEKELLSKNLLEITHPDDRQLNKDVLDNIENIVGDSFIHEKRYIRKDGGIVWVRISGSLIRNEHGEVTTQIGLAEDITVRKITESKLQESETQFRQLADLVPQLIWTADAGGNTDYMNQRWDDYTARFTGRNDSDWSSIIHPEDRRHATSNWVEALRQGQPFQAEFRLKKIHEKSFRWFLGKAIPVKNSTGEIYKWFGTCTDINDQKTMAEKMESLVRLRTEQLQRSNDDLLQFAHIASHDLKEPLRKIITFSSRITDELSTDLSPVVKRYLDKIDQAAQRMNRMIEGVLEYSVAGTDKLPVETVPLQQLLQDVLSDLEVSIERHHATVHTSSLPEVRGVPILLNQLFYNLINNSLKFSKSDRPPVITITGAVSNGEEVSELFDISSPGAFYKIVFSDNGIGFAPEQASKIFNTFARLNSKDRYEGTGLGLALCRKIVARHQGFIKASGLEGEGASFIVYLPMTQALEAI